MAIHNPYVTASRALILGLLMALCAACATPNNPALARARAEYTQTRQNADVAKFAPVALAEAGQSLRLAEAASGQDEITHLAYLAERKAEIAQAEAQTQVAANQAKALLGKRDELLLEARNREVRELRERLQAQNTARGPMITLGDVLFETGRAGLKPGAQQRLYELARFLLDHPERRVIVEGHTDSQGSESYNFDLSQRRAESVRAFLIGAGVNPERIGAEGLGESYPVASNNTSAGRLQNRRVEIYLPMPGQEGAGREG
ncbi:OmpA family protein [Methylomagnum sp.]